MASYNIIIKYFVNFRIVLKYNLLEIFFKKRKNAVFHSVFW